MAVYGGFNFTTFSGVNLKNTAAIRIVGDGGFVSTLSMRVSQDADRAFTFPDKSGTLPIMGTFRVQIAASAGNTGIFSTIVAVAGIRVEDALVVQLNKGVSASYSWVNTSNTAYIMIAANPSSNGNVELIFANLGQGTGHLDQIYSYLAMR